MHSKRVTKPELLNAHAYAHAHDAKHVLSFALLGTFKSEDEDDHEYEFSVLSMRIRFGGRHFSKCAYSKHKTRTRSRPRPPIERSLLYVKMTTVKPYLSTCPVGSVWVARYCGKMHSGHFFLPVDSRDPNDPSRSLISGLGPTSRADGRNFLMSASLSLQMA